MLAARYIDEQEPLALKELPEPDVGAREAAVEIEAASICGSDINYMTGKRQPASTPLTLGHEGAGVVNETGSAVEDSELAAGDRVVVHYPRFCGHCEPCLRGLDNQCENRRTTGHDTDGTFAETVVVPVRNLLELPESVPFEWGSMIGCAVTTGYHAVQRADIRWGDTVAVFGIGGVGSHAVLWSDFAGAGSVIAVDVDESQLATAREYGADVTVNGAQETVAERLGTVTDNRGVDVAIECSGSPVALEQAIASVDGENPHATGTVVSVGVQTEPFGADWQGLREGGLLVAANHSRSELRNVLDVVAKEDIDLSTSITHTVSLAEIESGFELMQDEAERTVRVVVEP
jgi:propanol-preferring alcohol dehydrogenase